MNTRYAQGALFKNSAYGMKATGLEHYSSTEL